MTELDPSTIVKWRVNAGHTLPHFDGKDRKTLKEGDEIDAPLWWGNEFAGRISLVNPIVREASDIAASVAATGRPLHEQAATLDDVRERMRKELAALDESSADLHKRAEAESKAQQEKDAKERDASGHTSTDASVKVTRLSPDVPVSQSAPSTPSGVESVEHL